MRNRRMNRREFVKGSAVAAAGSILPGARAETKDPAREWRHYCDHHLYARYKRGKCC